MPHLRYVHVQGGVQSLQQLAVQHIVRKIHDVQRPHVSRPRDLAAGPANMPACMLCDAFAGSGESTCCRSVSVLPAGAIGSLHLLPLYPSTGDRGFAPVTFQEVDKDYGKLPMACYGQCQLSPQMTWGLPNHSPSRPVLHATGYRVGTFKTKMQ